MDIIYPLIEGTRYKRQEHPDGSFIVEAWYEHKTELAFNNGKVIASIYNYLDEIQTDYTDPITFDYDGSQITAIPVNGVSSIDFTSTVTGEHVVKTVNPNMRNGEVTINV